jgi:hypothetical protein
MLSGCRICDNLTYEEKNNCALELALAAGATKTKDQNRPKAKRICVGIDTALKSYQR